MNGSIWVYGKTEDLIDYRIQVSGIKRGSYTKILDPIFKGWKQVGDGYNYKNSTEVAIYSHPFASEDEMVSWVKSHISFPTDYKKCNTKCTVKVLVGEAKVVKPSKRKKTA